MDEAASRRRHRLPVLAAAARRLLGEGARGQLRRDQEQHAGRGAKANHLAPYLGDATVGERQLRRRQHHRQLRRREQAPHGDRRRRARRLSQLRAGGADHDGRADTIGAGFDGVSKDTPAGPADGGARAPASDPGWQRPQKTGKARRRSRARSGGAPPALQFHRYRHRRRHRGRLQVTLRAHPGVLGRGLSCASSSPLCAIWLMARARSPPSRRSMGRSLHERAVDLQAVIGTSLRWPSGVASCKSSTAILCPGAFSRQRAPAPAMVVHQDAFGDPSSSIEPLAPSRSSCARPTETAGDGTASSTGSPPPAPSRQPAARQRRAAHAWRSDPVADGQHQAARLGDRDELVGLTGPRSGCCQRISILAARQAAVGKARSAAGKCSTIPARGSRARQAALHVELGIGGGGHGRFEEGARPHGRDFAWYIAVSACDQRLGAAAVGGNRRRRSRRRDRDRAGQLHRRTDSGQQRRATSTTPAVGRVARGGGTMNSSPRRSATPGRCRRRQPVMRPATVRSSVSPARWPSESLTRLKWSRSMNSSARVLAVPMRLLDQPFWPAR